MHATKTFNAIARVSTMQM